MGPTFRFLADLIVLLHVAFVLFVVLGGLLALRWPAVPWVHLPAALWGAWIEVSGGVCPLTPLENALRRRAGEAAYGGDFIGRYVLPVLYPHALTRRIQLLLAMVVVGVNVGVYWYVWVSRSSPTRARSARPGGPPRTRDSS